MSKQSLVLDADVLIFCDVDRLAGGVVDDRFNPKARCLTSGLVRLLEDLFLDPERVTTPTVDEIRHHGVDPQLRAQDPDVAHDLEGLVRYVESSTGFALDGPRELGPIEIERTDSDGVMMLDGEAAWRPAGLTATRRIGDHTLTFVVTDVDLGGAVREDVRLDAVGAVRDGSQLQLSPDMGNTCPVCAGCALCVACGEVNADSAVTSAVAVISAANEFVPKHDMHELQKLVDESVKRKRALAGVRRRVDTGA